MGADDYVTKPFEVTELMVEDDIDLPSKLFGDDENRDREFAGLARAMSEFGLDEGLVVTADQSDFAMYEGCTINVVPAWKYLASGDKES